VVELRREPTEVKKMPRRRRNGSKAFALAKAEAPGSLETLEQKMGWLRPHRPSIDGWSGETALYAANVRELRNRIRQKLGIRLQAHRQRALPSLASETTIG
jgi:hypothetical protein